MLNPQKSYIIPHNHSLTTDDLGFILPIEQNPLVSFENSLEFPSPFIKPSSRPKSYSFDLYEYRDFFHPLAFLKRMELEVKRLLPELRLFLYDTHNFLVIPFFLTNEIKSICLKIFNANIYELSSFQVKNALMAFEKLLSQFTKEIDSPDLHKESPNSLINTPEKKDFKGFSSQMEMNSPKPYSRESLKKKRTHPQYFSMQILRKTVFLLSKIGHLIHWRDISNGVTLGDFLLNKRELSQEEEFIMKQTLQRYFNWKLNHWKRENNKRFVINNEKNCFVEDRMICKICLKAIIIMKMPLHSELCMERSEVVRQIESLKSYFNRYCVKSNKNARYFEKVYGIQKKKKPSNSPLKISENLTIKHKKALTNTKNIKNKLKLKIYAEDNKIQGRYLDELSEKIENFPYNSPLNLQAQKNPILSEEKLTLIYRKIKLYDLIAKASSFFINEEMNQSLLFIYNYNIHIKLFYF